MKPFKMMLFAVALFAATALYAQEKTDSVKVSGNCGMCKKRIEKAALLDGVTSAVWDKATKMLTVTYDATLTSNDAIQKQVAAVGHDTEKYTASDKVYEKLPGCCLYERKSKEKNHPK